MWARIDLRRDVKRLRPVLVNQRPVACSCHQWFVRAMPVAQLTDRAVLSVTGADGFRLLNDVLTLDMAQVARAGIGYGALLSPQGKILFDFLIHKAGGEPAGDDVGWFIDVRRDAADDLAKRLGFYKLRADMEIAAADPALGVCVAWDEAARGASFHGDPRLAGLGTRGIIAEGDAVLTASLEDWHAHRIALGVPEGGLDFVFGQSFPHDAAMDDLHGVDFAKGCYVGQEVVSRMQHRGTARRRVVTITAKAPLPAAGAQITVDGRPAGILGTSTTYGDQARAIGIVRPDRLVADESGAYPVLVDVVDGVITMPDWVHYRPGLS